MTLSLLIKNTKITIAEKAMLTSKYRNIKANMKEDYCFESIREETKNLLTVEMTDTERANGKQIILKSKGKFR